MNSQIRSKIHHCLQLLRFHSETNQQTLKKHYVITAKGYKDTLDIHL